MVSPVRRPPECSYKYDGVFCEGRLVFSRMSEAPGAASGGAQRLAFLKLHLQGGLENELCDAVSSSEPSFLAGRIEEDDGDFAAVVGINDADALRHGQALHGSEPAARVDEPGDARRKRFDGDAGRDGQTPARRNGGFVFLGRPSDRGPRNLKWRTASLRPRSPCTRPANPAGTGCAPWGVL